MADKVTKNEIVDTIFNSIDCERKDIQKVINSFLDEVTTALENGKTIELRGFGTFEPRLRKGRAAARNPKTGEKVCVDSHYVAAFRAGQSLKDNLSKIPVKKDD